MGDMITFGSKFENRKGMCESVVKVINVAIYFTNLCNSLRDDGS